MSTLKDWKAKHRVRTGEFPSGGHWAGGVDLDYWFRGENEWDACNVLAEQMEIPEPPIFDASSLLSNPVAYRLTFDPNLRVVEDQFGEWMIERMGTYLRRYRARHIPDWTDDPIHAELHPTPEAAAQAAKNWKDAQG